MIRIMLVDDHGAVRAGLETVLGSEPGLEPVAATEGGEELWPDFHRTRPDLVLLDYHLPGQSSLQICRRVRWKSGHSSSLPSVAATGSRSGSRSSTATSPARTAGWSSTSMTRIMR